MKTPHESRKPAQPARPAPEGADPPADRGREPMPHPADAPNVTPPPSRDQRRNRSV